MLSDALILGLVCSAFGLDPSPGLDTPIACLHIAAEVSKVTDVYYPGSLPYDADNEHYASSSSQRSSCSVEPGSVGDVGTILRILGEMRTPFGVKGGGHATNPGFSSTTGVQIAMTRFKDITYDPKTQTAVIGAGNIWDDVYEVLNPRGANVLGGRAPGIGVAGFTLGGGYSWHSNQYGLAIDNVVAYELVMPNGKVTTVTAATDRDLFFSLKGGGKNFGIVTRFTLKTFHQGNIWGGTTVYPATVISAFTAAAVKFSSEVTDPKAAMLITFEYAARQIVLVTTMVYDGPVPPRGIFEDFLNMTTLRLDVKERSFVDLINSMPSKVTPRIISNDIPVSDYSKHTVDSLVEELKYWGEKLVFYNNAFVTYTLEPFLPTLFDHAGAGSSAYPGSRERLVLPTEVNLGWVSEGEDGVFHYAVREMTQKLGMVGASRYPNYAMYGTPVVDMYGEEGLKRMQDTRVRVDPDGVMQLTGGFKV
ncbi:FAD-binding domain-containing protein [Armillaria gallica]|uniref:FAD-binding domain-containing protein n=1 Tax=Armillaria gallica TaxID=47427 RepID=A0A2H3CQM4_ARMGA|nr:FAD-binding domain-containing protein [Armillaria gallica]